jgi:undecaprenyl diphosphate synthase
MMDGVEILTVYAFSTENWGRETVEVNTLMSIFAKYADSFKKEALEKNVKVIVFCTDDSLLPISVKTAIKSLQESTKDCSGFVVNICLSYGSRAEIVNACKSVVHDCSSGKIEVNSIDESAFSTYLSTKGISDPEVLIRTSGEYRLSNFLLWQLAYTELFFIDKYWPEINHSDLRFIMNKFYDRKRRFGL